MHTLQVKQEDGIIGTFEKRPVEFFLFRQAGVGCHQFGGALSHSLLQDFVLPGQPALQAADFQVGAHPGQNFFDLKGFGDVIYRPGLEAAHFIREFVQGADEDHRDGPGIWVFFQLLADLVAVHARHADIEQDQVGRVGGDYRQGGRAIGGAAHFVAVFLQHAGQHLQIGQGVIDDQDVAL